MNTELYDAILADINSAYQEWEEGRAASPSADDLVAIALDHRPAPEHAPQPQSDGWPDLRHAGGRGIQ